MPLGPIAEGLFSLVIAVAEGAARAISEAIRATDPQSGARHIL